MHFNFKVYLVSLFAVVVSAAPSSLIAGDVLDQRDATNNLVIQLCRQNGHVGCTLTPIQPQACVNLSPMNLGDQLASVRVPIGYTCTVHLDGVCKNSNSVTVTFEQDEGTDGFDRPFQGALNSFACTLLPSDSLR
ncbi:hypothetical protein C8R43DRAFT_1154965 [Mycena crocata]|nr:hypothetical protein C8R43DRAFT_1154965 [Mycena crocata]